jgi:hypothetical protein
MTNIQHYAIFTYEDLILNYDPRLSTLYKEEQLEFNITEKEVAWKRYTRFGQIKHGTVMGGLCPFPRYRQDVNDKH